MVGSLAMLTNCLTSGYKNGEVGIVVKTERVGELFILYWIMMSDGLEVPFWDSEFEVMSEKRGLDNNNTAIS
jgi:predicted AlkP superfamily phosphohydrolase/phosphomutase